MGVPMPGEVRLAVVISEELDDAVKDQCFWERETVRRFVETALKNEIERRQAEARVIQDPKTKQVLQLTPGTPYPRRSGRLKVGRPLKSE